LRQSVTSVDKLLDPQSIVVVGASNAHENLGAVSLRLMRKFNYLGDVYVVHPRETSVADFPAYRSLAELPAIPDVALLAVSAQNCLQAVRDCAAAGIKHVVAWAGGFVEAGEEGAAIQAAIADVCRAEGVAFVGPNCLGLLNAHSGFAATFAMWLRESDVLIPGGISMASQSGGMTSTAQAMVQRAGFGFRYSVSTGNEAVLGVADFISAFARDEKTTVIAAYIEGARDGQRLAEALEAARAAGKPTVILKAGRTAASAQAVAAHTGALAGEARVWDAVLRETGAIQVGSLEDLVETVLFLNAKNGRQRPKGRGVATVTFGGGNGVLSADQCATVGLLTPELSVHVREILTPMVPAIASTRNPVDLTPAFLADQFRSGLVDVFGAIASDAGVDSLLIQCAGPLGGSDSDVANAIATHAENSTGPTAVAWPLAPPAARQLIADRGVYACSEYARAVDALGKVTEQALGYAEWVADVDWASKPASTAKILDWDAVADSVGSNGVLTEPACHEILRAAGLPTADGRVARSREECLDVAKAVGFPVALKVASDEVTHRAAVGLVRLNLTSDDEVADAYGLLGQRAATLGIDGTSVYVQAMVPGDSELLLSAFRDPAFGVMVSCGAGGIFTEVLDDVTLARAPFGSTAARRLLNRLRVIQGMIKLGRTDEIDALADYVAQFSELACSFPWRRFTFELNPIRWGTSGAIAADGLLIIEERS
jgi:acyl-CoA synthetase (NDP forming)